MPALHDLLPKMWNRRPFDLSEFFDRSLPWSQFFEVDVKETEKLIMIEADLPGFNKEDIQVDLDDYSLTIKAYRSTDVEEKGENFFKRERQYGSVERTIPLPVEIITSSSTAKYEDGVLKITLEKAHPTISRRKTIEIE